jgi:short-subunit dehydrogenase
MICGILRWLTITSLISAGAAWLARYLRPMQSVVTLNGAVVVITGASSGIGRAYAEAFAKRGARLVLAARRSELLDEVRLAIEPYTADVITMLTDVTNVADLRRLFEQTMQHFGRIDVLINNAGYDVGGSLYSISLEDIRTMVRTNLEAPIALTQLMLPIMLAQRAGKIVNVSSIAGRIAQAGSTPYSSSKHGLMGFSDGLRRELFGTGVDVITVLPSWTRTDLVTPEIRERVGKIDEPAIIAERTIEGMLRGEHEIVFGDFLTRFGVFIERHCPALVDVYWRSELSPQYLETIRTSNKNFP